MPIPGPRPRGGGAGGGGGLAAVVHDSSLDGAGTAADPLAVSPAERAAARAVHGALRETLGEWDATLAATAGAVGYASEVDRSADGSPTTLHGSIAPTPPVLRVGADAWRVAAVRQRTDNHAVEIRLGAPNARKARRARAALAVGPNWADSGAALDARDTTYTVSVPNAATTGFAEFEVSAAALRALDEQTAGQAASPAAEARGRDYLLFDANDVGAAVPWRVGRDADSILLSTPVGEAVAVGIDADDGPPAAEVPEPPAGVDWRVGDLSLHLEDARATYSPRRVAGGRQTESLRTLTWTGVPAGTLRAGPATVRALGPAVDPAALPPRPTRADAGESLRVSAAGLYELYQPGAGGGGVHVGASPPAAPAVGALWMDTTNPADPKLKRWAVLASKSVRFARGHAGLVAGEVGANVALALPLDTARTLTWIYFRTDGDVEALVAPFGSRADLTGRQLSVAGRAYGDFSGATLAAGDARNPDLYSFAARASNPPTDEDVTVAVASWGAVDDHEVHAGAAPRCGTPDPWPESASASPSTTPTFSRGCGGSPSSP